MELVRAHYVTVCKISITISIQFSDKPKKRTNHILTIGAIFNIWQSELSSHTFLWFFIIFNVVMLMMVLIMVAMVRNYISNN